MDEKNMYFGADRNIFKKAAMRRKCETPAEKILWKHLRKSQINGYKFRRQHPLVVYIADFYCHKAKLVIEVDEKYHEKPEQRLNDKIRTEALGQHKLRVLRFTDEQILQDIDFVIATIKQFIGGL